MSASFRGRIVEQPPDCLVQCLVRYGVIPEVARCHASGDAGLARGDQVVVETHRGLQHGTVVEVLRRAALSRDSSSGGSDADDEPAGFEILRRAAPGDVEKSQLLRTDAEGQFSAWVDRIAAWKVDVQVIDLEWTLDRSKLVVYVLNERGPECTKLAIQAAAAGLGVIEVQPVAGDGPVALPTAGGGCGTCGCHS